VKLVIADDHKACGALNPSESPPQPAKRSPCGPAGARRVFNATRQRCRTHWLRNALAHAPAKQRTTVAAMLKTIFAQQTKADAEAQWNVVADALRETPPNPRRVDGSLARRRAGLHVLPSRALGSDSVHGSARTGEPRDQASGRDHRHLPE
jgi:Transposase, Mutator family